MRLATASFALGACTLIGLVSLIALKHSVSLAGPPYQANADHDHHHHHHQHHHDHDPHHQPVTVAERPAQQRSEHDICWSGDRRWCDATAAGAPGRPSHALAAVVPPSMLPACARAGAELLADGFEFTGSLSASGWTAWSDPATWGGNLPQPGQSVLIPSGRNVVLDVPSPALATLTIEGNLIAAHDRDLVLSANVIMVHGGSLRIGCADDPYLNTATITLTGAPSNANPHDMGTKVLGAMAGGRIEIFGRPVRSWTRLAANAAAGANQISVLDASGWRVGDRIVVVSGSSEPNEAETRTITAISGQQLTLDAPLTRPRLGVLRVVDGRSIDMRTAVGLLSRNITIQGDASSETTRFGGHMMTMVGSQVRVDGVRFFRMGQFDRIGRYPFHWHIVGDAPGQFVRNCAVDGSFQRGIVVHATRDVEVANNVVFDTIGHNYVIEDPAAIRNTLRDNLAVKTRLAFFTDPELRQQKDDEASNFWIRAARNTFIGNLAAGAEANGYWYDDTTDAPTTFRGNAVHSAAARADHVPFNRQAGLLIQDTNGDPARPPLEFEDTLLYRNTVGMWPQAEADTRPQVHRRVVLVDHTSGFLTVFEAVGALIVFEDALFIGHSAGPTPPSPVQTPVHFQYGASVELVRPIFAHFGTTPMLSSTDIFAEWQADVRISGARFVASNPGVLMDEDMVLHAVDDSYLPAGMYTEATGPQLAGPGATLVSIGGVQMLRSPQPVGHAFLMTRVGNTNTHSNTLYLVRSDGLRYNEPNSPGFRVAYGSGLAYRYESLPTTAAEFGVRLDLFGGRQRDAIGPPRATIVLPVTRAPLGMFRPNDAGQGWAPPGSGNALQAASSLAEFQANPLTRYWYDVATQRLHFTASERWVVIRP